MLFLHTLAFLPLLTILVFYAVNHRHSLNAGRIARELAAYAGTLVPFLALYYLVILFRLLALLPRFGPTPIPPKDPVLATPSWGVLAGILGITLALAALSYLLIRFLISRRLPPPDFGASKLLLLGILTAVILLTLARNSYLAVDFLLLPAWIWGFVGMGHSLPRKAIAWLSILAAGLPVYVAAAAGAAFLGLGREMIWYLTLSLSNGLFDFTGYLLAAAVIATGIRFLVIQCLRQAT